MDAFLKNWVKASKETRFALAVVYVLAAFIGFSNHTDDCTYAELHCYVSSAGCSLPYVHGAYPQTRIKSNYNNSDNTALSDNHYCPACMYWLTSKTSKTNLPIVSVVVKNAITIQTPAYWVFTNQFEWLASVSLRGPPIIFS